MLRAAVLTNTQNTSVHRVPKRRHQSHCGNSINSQPIFKPSVLSLFPVNLQQSIPTVLRMGRCTILFLFIYYEIRTTTYTNKN